MRARFDRDTRWWLWALGIGQAFVLSALFLQNLFRPGYLLHNDFVTPLRYTGLFLGRFLSSWDTVVGGFSYSTPKLSIQLWVAALASVGVTTALLYKLIVVFILGLAGATMFHLVYRRAGDITTPWRAYAAASLAGLLFMMNPWTINKIHHHFWLVLGIAILPLIYLLYLRLLDGRGGLVTLLALSGLFVLEATQPHSLFIFAGPVLAITAIAYLLEAPSLDRTWRVVRVTAKLFVLAVLLNLFWVLPLGLFYANNAPTPGGYLLTVENILSMSRHSSMVRVTQLRSGIGMRDLIAPGYSVSYRTGIDLLNRLWPVAGVGIIAFSLTGLLDRAVSRLDRLAFSALAVLALWLFTGSQPPLGDLYITMTLDLPLGWMLRDPFKFGGLFMFGLAALFGFASASLLERARRVRQERRLSLGRVRLWPLEVSVRPGAGSEGSETRFSAVIVTVLLLLTAFHGWPMATGDLNKHFEPSTVPDEYDQALDWIDHNTDGARVLWLPYGLFSVEDPRAYNFNWTTDLARWHVRSSKFLEFSTPETVMPQNPQNKRLIMWLYRKLKTGTVERPSVPLQAAGVGYVAFHTDVNARMETRAALSTLLDDPAIEEVFQQGNVHVLRVENSKLLRAGPALETYDLDNLDTLYQAGDGQRAARSPVAVTFRSNISARDGMISSGSTPPLYLDAGQSITPFDATSHHAPGRRWSKSQTHDPWQGRWHRYLTQRMINTWQTAFGEGIAFTWADERVPKGVTPEPGDRLGQWRFVGYKVPPGWTNLDPQQNVTVTHGHLSITLDQSSYGWKRVASPAVDVSPNETYLFTFDVTGQFAHGVHAKIAEYDTEGDLVHMEPVAGFPEGNFTRDRVAVDYVPRNPNTTALRLQVWHGHETEQPLPNEVRLDNVRVYNASAYTRPVSITTNVTVEQSGEYRLFGRYFASRDGGQIRISLDGEPVQVRTKASFDRFVWDELLRRNLTAGTHTVTIENVYGFNAVNLLRLIDEERYVDNRAHLDQELRNKSVIYHLDGVSDLRIEEAKRIFRNRNGSVRPALALRTSGRAWRELNVPKSGWYDVSVRGSGQFEVHVDNRTIPFESEIATGRQGQQVYLTQGEHRVSVTPVRRTLREIGFENESDWYGGKDEFTVEQDETDYRGARSLRVETDSTARDWSYVYTDAIPVESGQIYDVAARLKYRNVEQSHVVLEGYDATDDSWRRLALVSSGRVGTADWQTVRETVTVPDNVDRLRFALNAGWVHETDDGPAVTWFDGLTVEGVQDNVVDAITLASTPDGQSVADVLAGSDGVATVTDYEQRSPTRYQVQVTASEPYMLSFAKGFDPLWVAEIQTPDGVETVRATRLSSSINGFWIDQTGEYTVTIRYRGQRWLQYGALLSLASLLACLGLVVGRRRRWHEQPALRKAREHVDRWTATARDRLDTERLDQWVAETRDGLGERAPSRSDRADWAERRREWAGRVRYRVVQWVESARESVTSVLERRWR